MATPRIAKTIESLLDSFNDRLRRLELRRPGAGNWTLVEDQGTGQLLAVRDNGQNVPQTIVILANP